MPRKPIIRTNLYPYHVVARTHNKEWFSLPISRMWEIYIELLLFVQKECDARILCFVLMNNHFHLMLLTPRENIDKIMYWIMKKSTLQVQSETGIINSIYGSRYKSSVLLQKDHVLNTFKYLLQNPVKAKIVEKIENYPYSISQLIGAKREPGLNLSSIPEIIVKSQRDFDEFLVWANEKYNDEENRSMKQAISRSTFKYQKNDNTKKLIIPPLPQIYDSKHPD